VFGLVVVLRTGSQSGPPWGPHEFSAFSAGFAEPKLPIIDELGYLPLEPQAGHLFFQLISRRYEQSSVLNSSNRSVEE
jgi:DNA replication protein DnaC